MRVQARFIRSLLVASALLAAGGIGLAIRAPAADPGATAAWAWHSEEHWAVDHMTQDSVELVLAAAGEDPGQARAKVSPEGPRTYRLDLSAPDLGSFRTRIRLDTHLWDPEAFVPLVKDLARQLKLSPKPAAPGNVLDPLLSPTPATIDQVQAELSRALTAAPACPALHEQAAFTLGVLGLFDQSVAFEDHRALLCRMTAHLALAQGLRSGLPSPEGRLAQAALLILEGRKAQALAGLDGTLPAPWRTTLALFAAEDWRPVPDAGKASLAEALAAFKDRSRHLGADRGADWLLAARRTDLPMGYVARVTMAGNDYSVSHGHQLTGTALEADLADLKVLLAAHGKPGAGPDAISALAASPSRCWNPASGSLEVIGWGLWAQRTQAILLCDMMQTISFLDAHYGEQASTKAYLDWIETWFAGLEQFPVLQKRYANLRPSVYNQAMAKAVRLCREHPERLSDCSLICLHHPPEGRPVPPGLPRYQDWLELPTPVGTAYNWTARTWEMDEVARLAPEDMARYLQMDPGNASLVASYLACRYPDQQYRREGVEAACAGIKAFDRTGYLSWLPVTYPEHAPDALPILRELADQDPGWLGRLAKERVLANRPQEASVAYLELYDREPDQVRVANAMIWEVLYLYRLGETGQAERIAAHCAQAWARRKAELFPRGMRRFDPAQEPAPAARGAQFTTVTAFMARMGLTQDGVIVALDGYRVENLQQYYLVRALRWQDDLTLVVCRGGKYQTIHADPHHRRFGVDMKDYAL